MRDINKNNGLGGEIILHDRQACCGRCGKTNRNAKLGVRTEQDIRICETGALEVAVAGALGRRADVVLYRAGSTEHSVLERVVNLLGGDRESGPFGRYRRIAYDPRKQHSVAESCAAHPLHTDGSFDFDVPAFFALHCEVADPTGGGINTFLSHREMRGAMPSRLFDAMCTADVRFGRQDDSGRVDAYVGPMYFIRNGTWALRWRDDDQVGPVVANARGTPIAEAIEWVRGYLRSVTPVGVFVCRGDIAIVNNDTVLHGRTKLSPNSPRSVIRAWIQN